MIFPLFFANQNCTVDALRPENIGPDFLYNLTYVPFSLINQQLPEFVCQKIEAYKYTSSGNIFVFHEIKCLSTDFFLIILPISKEIKRVELRRCAVRLGGDQTCDYFYTNYDKFGKNIYINASCYICDEDSCNSGAFNCIWIPLLFASIISCLLMK